MNSTKVFIGLVVGGIAVMVSGCATNPTSADLMRDHRSDVEIRAQAESELKDQLAEDWEKGKKLITSGKKNIEAGEKRIESAERDLARGKNQLELGERELAEGTELVRESERRFRDEFSELELSGSR